MKYEEIPETQRKEYTQICPCCGSYTTILSQGWGSHEYDTNVYLECCCGEWLEFILPVN